MGRRKRHEWLAACAFVLIALAGCSSSAPALPEPEAVRDYIVAAELKEVDAIYTERQPYTAFSQLNDHYIIVRARRGDVLVEIPRRCHALREQVISREVVVDKYDSNYLRTGYDTIRGCRIGKLYEITRKQSYELKALGDAPGDNIYLPEEE